MEGVAFELSEMEYQLTVNHGVTQSFKEVWEENLGRFNGRQRDQHQLLPYWERK